MAKISSGILGAYSGTIGNVTGYRRNGQGIIQARPGAKRITANSTIVANKENLEQFWTLHKFFRYRFLQFLQARWPSIKFFTSTYLSFGLAFTITPNNRKQAPIIIKTETSIDINWSISGMGNNNDAITLTVSGLNSLRNRYGTLYVTRVLGNLATGISTNDVLIVTGNSYSITTVPNSFLSGLGEIRMFQVHNLSKSFSSHIFSTSQKRDGTY